MFPDRPKKKTEEFYCDKCDIIFHKKSHWERHIFTTKHNSAFFGNNLETEKGPDDNQCQCGRAFKTRTGLWKHQKSKKCIVDDNTSQTNIHTLTNAVLDVVKQSNEFRELIIEQHKQIIELTKQQAVNVQNNNNNNNNTNNILQVNNQVNKQKFNLNFFLNETCKDAMNITDFVNSLQIQFSDIEKVGELGYAEGISRIFMKGLKELDVCKRPVHCTDLKREIMHIKNNNKWEKEISLLQKAIKIITNNNINKITDWKNAHPGCTDGENKLNDKYCKIMYESMGPIDEEQEQKDFSKIIRNIAKCTVIDKAYEEND